MKIGRIKVNEAIVQWLERRDLGHLVTRGIDPINFVYNVPFVPAAVFKDRSFDIDLAWAIANKPAALCDAVEDETDRAALRALFASTDPEQHPEIITAALRDELWNK